MKMTITGHTKLTGLLGSPVSHSISPLMHNTAFEQLDLNYAYLCFDTGNILLKNAVNALCSLNARGWNCTMPTKQEMCELCNELSPAARMIGAVNTVVNENGTLIGHNTDGIGYMRSICDTGLDLKGQTMTLLGAGGAATAIAIQAALDGLAKINLFVRKGRSLEHAVKISDTINTKTNATATLYDINDTNALQSAINQSLLLTNGTSVGMTPKEEDCVLPLTITFPKTLTVSDIIYNPRQTQLLKRAAEAGCPTQNGLYMLLYQGAEAFRLWTGKEMPVEYIKQHYFTL